MGDSGDMRLILFFCGYDHIERFREKEMGDAVEESPDAVGEFSKMIGKIQEVEGFVVEEG